MNLVNILTKTINFSLVATQRALVLGETVIHMESLGSTHKKQNDKDDIISKLPDSVIGHILSFLPTKYAVRTSVLSKRWIENWTLIPKVKLDDSLFYSTPRKESDAKQNFINFVYKTLHFTQNYSMQSFSLFIRNNYDPTLLNTWISCIFKKRVKKLSICSTFELPFSALTSHALFNHCNALEELMLRMSCCAIKVPPSPFGYFIFGSLIVLKLRGIIFTIDESLVIHLSVLKTFDTKRCSWLSAHDVTIEAPLLESVLIEDSSEVLEISCSNGCRKSKVAVLPKFAMLSHLDLACVSGKVLLGLLQKTPVINTLVLRGISSFDQELLNSAVVPDCLASSLQVVEFEYVRCYQHELLLAKFFMENGTILERMSFSLAYGCERIIEEFKEELYSFKKRVSFAILEFYN
ncbi:F-box/FBD/LRR-repeat protein [Trifolium repens]|nr:F-box/FBD/LRR-repeat protein [Trifolium repens]